MRIRFALFCLILPIMASAQVDEPLGARYSLGLTHYHMGHDARYITQFHDFLRQSKLTPEKLLPVTALKPPATMQRVLLEPEFLPPDLLNGWQVNNNLVVSGAGDAGPTLTIPLRLPKAGLYRLWVRYLGRPECRGVTFLKIYRAGQEQFGPICQPDEFYDMPAAQAGPQWHDMLVDLPAGELLVKIGHVTRWWHGGGGYDERKVDCLYLTEELWADPPSPEMLAAMSADIDRLGGQFDRPAPLAATDREAWAWWQVRPLSWEDAATNPKLFGLNRAFWRQTVAELAKQEYAETRETVPDYRAPERQLVFNETWNMVANPVRARRQIEVLQRDVLRQPPPYHYVWHDVGRNIPDLTSENKPAPYGGWTFYQNCLFASYGSPTGAVATEVPVRTPGRYSVWVLSEGTNLSYTAPWFGTASVNGQEQFKYHHEGEIPSLWMKMGEATVEQPGTVRVEFTLDNAGVGGTYRRIYTLFLVDDPNFVPKGTVRPPWTMEMYRERAQRSGAKPTDRVLMWTPDDPYQPLSQEVWADESAVGRSWPSEPVQGPVVTRQLLMARDTRRALQVCLRNLTDQPLTVQVKAALGPANSRADVSSASPLQWRVVAFAPYGADRQNWTPFFLLRRPDVTIPPLSVAGVWLTVDTQGMKPGDYTGKVSFTGQGIPEHAVNLKARVSPVAARPTEPVWVDGYTQPPEGEAYLRDYVEHGMNVWRGIMPKSEMQKWGIRQQAYFVNGPDDIAKRKEAGLDYSDWFAVISDEPSGKTEEELKPFLDVAKALKAADPQVRISFNPGEAASLPTFQTLAPWCDFWLPYSLHLSPYWGGPEKWAIYKAKPWMWYTTPCLWDKSPLLPAQIFAQIRQFPSQTGLCRGTSFFALNYPFRDPWDTAYEHIPDASVMGALPSRHGPVATRTWEAIGEAAQEANLALLVRERLGVKVFEEITDEAVKKLVTEGKSEELIRWLEAHP